MGFRVLERRQTMNRKPSWGLWLLMIVAPLAVFFGIRYLKHPVFIVPKKQLLISVPARSTEITLSDIDTDVRAKGWCAIKYSVSNPAPFPINVDIQIVSGDSELSTSINGKTDLKNGTIVRTIVPANSFGTVTAFYMRFTSEIVVELKRTSPQKTGLRTEQIIYG